MTTITTATRIEVTLWTHESGAFDLTGALLSVQTGKALGAQGAGQWSFVVRPDRVAGLTDALSQWSDDDWLGIVAVDRLGGHPPTVLMWGPVDAVWRSRQVDQRGALTTTEITVNGSDFSAMMERSELLFNVYLQRALVTIPGLVDRTQHAALVDLAVTAQTMPPHDLALLLLQLLCGTPPLWRLPPGLGVRHLSSVLQYEQHVIEGVITQMSTYTPMAPVSIAAYLRSIYRSPWVEVFYDMRPSTPDLVAVVLDLGSADDRPGPGAWFRRYEQWPTIVIRPMPYGGREASTGLPSDAAIGLRRHTIDRAEVIADRLGVSGAERRTVFAARTAHWRADSSAGTWGQAGGYVPLFAVAPQPPGLPVAADVERHGLRLLELTDPHAPAGRLQSPTTATPPIDWVRNRTAGAYEMQADYPRQWQGTITLARLRPEIRIGERVDFEGRLYYVEGVAHEANVNPDDTVMVGSTTVTVSRGRRYVRAGVILTEEAVTVPGPWPGRPGP